MFRPTTGAPAKGHPAIIFFHGGGWEGGSVRHFYAQAQHFASRGMVAMSVEYRTLAAHGTGPYEATADSFMAMRWVRRNAAELSVDPDAIVVGGGSVGGHMAAAVTFLQELAEPGEDDSASSSGNAMVFFNSVLETTERGWGASKLGEDRLRFSPVHNVKEGLPPSIVLHGTADKVTPFENAARFTAEMKRQGNVCELFTYPDVGHGFYRYSLNRPLYRDALQRCDEFLVSLGFLDPPETSEDSDEA